MKKIITSSLLFIFLITLPMFTIAQQRDPGDPGGEPGGGDPPLGGGAPIGSGLVILLGLGAAYGGRKLYDLNKERLEE